ncbi:hypothetical protein [Spirosoma fluminis]
MSKLKKTLTAMMMILIWGITLVVALGATNHRGLASILCTGIAVNALVAMYYSCIDRRPASFRQWLSW